MKEKPILFSCEMVRAILDGRKTQTRRVITPQPYLSKVGDGLWGVKTMWGVKTKRSEKAMALINATPDDVVYWCKQWCPYGYAGDQLWVRETWATPGNYDHIKPSELAASHFSSSELVYRATDQYGDVYYKWRPSIFMPRWASRITLEITGVRVERVQDISHSDIMAEGCRGDDYAEGICALDEWATLWDSINVKRGYGWDVNPWVWVVKFRRI